MSALIASPLNGRNPAARTAFISASVRVVGVASPHTTVPLSVTTPFAVRRDGACFCASDFGAPGLCVISSVICYRCKPAAIAGRKVLPFPEMCNSQPRQEIVFLAHLKETRFLCIFLRIRRLKQVATNRRHRRVFSLFASQFLRVRKSQKGMTKGELGKNLMVLHSCQSSFESLKR